MSAEMSHTKASWCRCFSPLNLWGLLLFKPVARVTVALPVKVAHTESIDHRNGRGLHAYEYLSIFIITAKWQRDKMGGGRKRRKGRKREREMYFYLLVLSPNGLNSQSRTRLTPAACRSILVSRCLTGARALGASSSASRGACAGN